jgi:predicted transcriptional regulator
MPKPVIATATIAAGTALSGSIDLSAGAVTMVIVPAQWSGANIGFMVSVDNINFYDLVDALGAEILRLAVAGTAVLVDPSMTQSALYLKIRSGQATHPVIQSSDCVFTFAIQ